MNLKKIDYINTTTFTKLHPLYFTEVFPYNDCLNKKAIIHHPSTRFLVYANCLTNLQYKTIEPIFFYTEKTHKTILFEIDQTKKYRKLINLFLENKDHFVIIRHENYHALFVFNNDNLAILEYTTFNLDYLYSLVSLFANKYDVYIDITAYHTFFIRKISFCFFKEVVKYKSSIADNALSFEHFNSNWLDRITNKKGIIGSINGFVFTNNRYLGKKGNFFTNKKGNHLLLSKDSLTPNDEPYCLLDFATFANQIKDIESFSNDALYSEEKLAVVYSFNGYFIGIQNGKEIISGACLEKVGKQYILVSYIFTNSNYLHQGYGSKILGIIDKICSENTKKPLLVCQEELSDFFTCNNYQILDKVKITIK